MDQGKIHSSGVVLSSHFFALGLLGYGFEFGLNMMLTAREKFIPIAYLATLNLNWNIRSKCHGNSRRRSFLLGEASRGRNPSQILNGNGEKSLMSTAESCCLHLISYRSKQLGKWRGVSTPAGFFRSGMPCPWMKCLKGDYSGQAWGNDQKKRG